MDGDPVFVLLKTWAWCDASASDKILGAVVKDFLKPTDNYEPPRPRQQYDKEKPIERAFTDFAVRRANDRERIVEASLGSLVGVKFAGKTDESFNLSGKRIRFKRIQQRDRFWAALKKDRSVQDIVPGWMSAWNWNKPPVCLVVGVFICEDVEVLVEREQIRKREAHGQAPVAAVTLAAGVPYVLGDWADPQVSAAAEERTGSVFVAKSGQKSIFALELMVVTTALLRKKELELKNRGPKVPENRQLGDGGDEDDVEVSADEMVLDDLNQGYIERMFAE